MYCESNTIVTNLLNYNRSCLPRVQEPLRSSILNNINVTLLNSNGTLYLWFSHLLHENQWFPWRRISRFAAVLLDESALVPGVQLRHRNIMEKCANRIKNRGRRWEADCYKQIPSRNCAGLCAISRSITCVLFFLPSSPMWGEDSVRFNELFHFSELQAMAHKGNRLRQINFRQIKLQIHSNYHQFHRLG